MNGHRGSLTRRTALLSVGIAVLTAVVAGAIAIGLVRQANDRNASQTLARLADAAVTSADGGVTAQGSQQRARRTLNVLGVEFALINRAGRIVSPTSALAQQALSPVEVADVLNKQSLSLRRRVNGQPALIEARPTDAGGVVLVQTRASALQFGDEAIRRLLLALVIAVVIAMVLGIAFASRLNRPLRRLSEAARALAAGRRDVVVDTTGPAEVAEVGDAINNLNHALAASESRQRDFLLSVSHDLRTPLTAITGFAESLSDGLVSPDQLPQVANVLLTEAHRLNRLVVDLLDLARLDAQEFRVDPGLLDLSSLAQAAAEVWDARCRASGVEFHLELPGYSTYAVTDALRLRQVVDGLLENALRVTPSGRPIVVAVRGETGPRAPLAVVEVRDGGPGLTEADLAIAFDRSALYDRYRGVRQVGTGLGLAIVHGLVSRLGGTVEAGHAIEGGARFTVRLPMADTRTAQPGQIIVRPG